MTNLDWISIATSLPLDGVELYWPSLRHLSDDQLLDVRRAAETGGLALPLMCASPDFTQLERELFEREIADEARAIRATSLLGGNITRVLSGQRREGLSHADGVALTVEAISRLLPVADAYRVTLAIENHFRDYFWNATEFAQDTDTFLAILRSVPHDAPFGVQFDASNALAAGEDPYALLQAVGPRVVAAAASDREFRRDGVDPSEQRVIHRVVGDGVLDYDRIFDMLAAVGFSGWVSIEDGDDPTTGPADLERSADYTRAAMRRHGLS